MVVEVDAVVPRAETEMRLHLHHLDAGGVGIVGELRLRNLCRSPGGCEECQPQGGYGDAMHHCHVALHRRDDKCEGRAA